MSAGFDKQAAPASQAGLRVSDAERDAAAAELREHYAAGRLTADELNERISQAFAARTRGDISAVMRDLPSLRAGTTPLPTGQPSSGAGWTGQDWTGQGWTGQGWGAGHGWRGAGGRRPGAGIGAAIAAMAMLCVLAGFGILAAFGTGGGGARPFGVIALVLAALAMLRRLVFRRRRQARRARAGRGPHRR
jgi:hypothetical protein